MVDHARGGSSAARSVARLSLQDGSPSRAVLSGRENEVLDLVAGGASNGQIAEALRIAPGTVSKHLEHIYAKLNVGSRTAALARTGRSASSHLDT